MVLRSDYNTSQLVCKPDCQNHGAHKILIPSTIHQEAYIMVITRSLGIAELVIVKRF